MTSPEIAPDSDSLSAALRRMRGIALRHIYLYSGSWPRLVEMMYWPMLDMTLFGFVSLSIVNRYGHVDVLADAFLAGVMLMEVLTRSIMAMLVGYMEEVWSRNLGHLFASPLRLRDYVGSLIGLSITRCIVAIIPAFFVVYCLFDFSILKLGWNLILYIALLCFNGWWYGLLIISLLMRFGLAAEWLGWMCIWLVTPFLAPYYPISVLPHAFQFVSRLLPGTYVFESMKAQLATGNARFDYFGIAFVLNVLYFAIAVKIFNMAFRSARKSGGLLQMGE